MKPLNQTLGSLKKLYVRNRGNKEIHTIMQGDEDFRRTICLKEQ